MKAKPLKRVDGAFVLCAVEEATYVELHFPVNFPPFQKRYLPVQLHGSRADTSNWSWNGDVDMPTLKPSILIEADWGEERTYYRCHSFVNNGIVQFLSDCTHDKRGTFETLLKVLD